MDKHTIEFKVFGKIIFLLTSFIVMYLTLKFLLADLVNCNCLEH